MSDYLRRQSINIPGIWLVLRLITSLEVALVSNYSPVTEIERTIPLWPPSIPIGRWLERVSLSPLLRWDAVWYQKITQVGYASNDGTAQFHPLYAWLAVPLYKSGIHPLLSLLIVNTISGVLLLIIFIRLARLDLEDRDVNTSLLLFLFFPAAFVFFVPYSEGLFLLMAALCLLWMRQRKWWLASLAGALATLTRQQGIFLVLPMAWELWEQSGRSLSRIRTAWRDWLALGVIPFGMLIWIVYRAIAINDLHVNLNNLQSLIYSILISPSSNQIVETQYFLWPWQSLWLALSHVWLKPDLDLVINLVLGAYFIVILVLAWRGMRISYRIYVVIMMLVAFSYYTGPIHPYMGLPRHLYLAFPLFIGLAPVVKYPWTRLLAVATGWFGMLFLLLTYTKTGWIP